MTNTITASNLIIALVGTLLALNFAATLAMGSPVHLSSVQSDHNKQQNLVVQNSLGSETQQPYQAEDAQQQVSDELISSLNNNGDESNSDRKDKLPETAQKQQQDQLQPTVKPKESVSSVLRRQSRLNSSGAGEKLKRGLANFMNQLNPAPYFVPALTAQQQFSRDKQSVSAVSVKTTTQQSSSSDLSAIVNGDSTPDALIKGRLALIRPIGGPMRWGRR